MKRGNCCSIKFCAKPCCCQTHRSLDWAAMVQWLLDDPEHMADSESPEIASAFHYERRLRFRIKNNVLEYRCMIWDEENYSPYVRSADCGLPASRGKFYPIGKPCKHHHCECAHTPSTLESRVLELEEQLKHLTKKKK